MNDTVKRLDPTPRTFEMDHDPDAAQDSGAVGVEYGLLIAVFGAVVLGVLLALGGQLVDVYNILVRTTLDERVNTTIISMVWSL
jgi:Flp pilus assembly pilin Flp